MLYVKYGKKKRLTSDNVELKIHAAVQSVLNHEETLRNPPFFFCIKINRLFGK
jgi:hypothetical protein